MLLEQRIRFNHLSQALTKIPHRRHRGNSQRRPPLLTQISYIYVHLPTYRDRSILTRRLTGTEKITGTNFSLKLKRKPV